MQVSTPSALKSYSQDELQQSSRRQSECFFFALHSLDISSKASALNQSTATKTTKQHERSSLKMSSVNAHVYSLCNISLFFVAMGFLCGLAVLLAIC